MLPYGTRRNRCNTHSYRGSECRVSMATMQRRHLLKLGLGATAVLAVTGGGLALWQPGLSNGRLTSEGVAVLRAVARAVLDGSLPTERQDQDAALQSQLARVNVAVSSFPPATLAELSKLLALLATAPGRMALTGLRTRWESAEIGELQRALEAMRTSTFDLRKQIYHALRDLTNAAYYADPDAWPLLGYPGPRAL